MGDQREPDSVQERTVGQESPGTSDAPPLPPVRPPGRRPGPGQPPGGAAAAPAGPGPRSVVTSCDRRRKKITVLRSPQTCRPPCPAPPPPPASWRPSSRPCTTPCCPRAPCARPASRRSCPTPPRTAAPPAAAPRSTSSSTTPRQTCERCLIFVGASTLHIHILKLLLLCNKKRLSLAVNYQMKSLVEACKC